MARVARPEEWEVNRMVSAQCPRDGSPRPWAVFAFFEISAARRHVDLLRVNSALCPGDRLV